jgi:hypothetical protein
MSIGKAGGAILAASGAGADHAMPRGSERLGTGAWQRRQTNVSARSPIVRTMMSG